MASSPVGAEVIWDEGIDGDLSNDQAAPTPIFFALDSTQDTVIGNVGGANPGEFFDDMTFDVFYGFCLESVLLVDYVADGGNTTSGFNLWEGPDALTTFLGSTTSGPANIGQNVLDGTTPVSAGTYTLDIREGTPNQSYEIDYVLCNEAYYNEAFDGDFSDDDTTPTDLGVLPLTDNQISGTIGGAGGLFVDALSFTVPTGFTADVILRAYVAAGGNDTSGFNYYEGVGVGGAVVSSASFGATDIGTTTLTTGPLPEGTYTLVLLEGTEGQQYGFDFQLTDLIYDNGFELIVR
ncbi:hypothetical protein [Marinicella meishanensis]|uniref:hypothetical protein n=1 Tax=Marinicella meishanensis TaxID=2873263 RepID=UPI001CC16FF9|nr:hypothetical protein [Marinicella sp. NBU2979]